MFLFGSSEKSYQICKIKMKENKENMKLISKNMSCMMPETSAERLL